VPHATDHPEDHPIAPKALQTTQDIGYYALGSPNLSKSYVPCTFLASSSSGSWRQPTYKITTLGVSLGGRGGKLTTFGKAPNVADLTIIKATTSGLQVGSSQDYLDRYKPSTMGELFDVMQEYCKLDRGRRTSKP
jgi:hypothetical protein